MNILIYLLQQQQTNKKTHKEISNTLCLRYLRCYIDMLTAKFSSVNG